MTDWADRASDAESKHLLGAESARRDNKWRTTDRRQYAALSPAEANELDRCARCKGRYVKDDYVNGTGVCYCSRGCAQETPSADHLFASAYHYGPATGKRWLGPL